ncbi:MAG: glycosyltransferase family 4 protein [Priestia megaterium]
MKVLALTRLPEIDPSNRYRINQFLPILNNIYNIEVDLFTFYDSKNFEKYKKKEMNYLTFVNLFYESFKTILNAKKYDVVWILRSISPIEMPLLVKYIKKQGVRVVYEFDDAIYVNQNKNSIKRQLSRSWKAVSKYSRLADHIIVGNEILHQWASQHNNKVSIIPTGIDVFSYPIKKYSRSEEVVTLGWLGSTATSPNLYEILPVLESLSEELRIRLVIIGGETIQSKKLEIINLEWSKENEKKWLPMFDIGIGPLTNNEFNKGKCGFKLIQYMATSLPVIASPVGIQKEMIINNTNGFLANTIEEWETYIRSLILDEELRKQMGKRGREIAETKYDTSVLVKQITEVLLQEVSN